MNRKTAFILAWALFLPLAAPAQSIVPSPACCPRIYDTGRWLGWAWAMLEHARDEGGPTPAEGDIIRCLQSAGQSAQAAYQACSSGVPAWADWKQRQLWINGWIAELRHPGNSTKQRWMRWELVASAIDTAYGQWADELSWQKLGEQMLKRKTCAACFFLLGFDLAGATQSYRLAMEANASRELSTTKRLQVTLRELNRTRLRLKKALAVLDAYRALKGRSAEAPGCPEFDESELERRIRAIALTAPSMTRAAEEFRYVNSRSDGVGILLGQNCIAGSNSETTIAPPSRTADGSGQVFIATYVRLHSFTQSQGFPLNTPIMVCQRTGKRSYRILRQRRYNHTEHRLQEWEQVITGSQFKVFGEWLYQEDHANYNGKIGITTTWLPRVRDEWLSQLREGHFDLGIHYFPPNIPDSFRAYNTPPHCPDNEPGCSGDITGNWVNSPGGWCIRIEPEKK